MQKSSLVLGLAAIMLAALADPVLAACHPCLPPPVPILVDIGLAIVGTVQDTQAPVPVDPPDTMGAVGSGRIVELNNQQFQVRDKANGNVTFQTTFDNFWKSLANVMPNGGATDPRLLFDKTSQRWFAAAIDKSNLNVMPTSNTFLLGVSKGPNPTGPWNGFAISSDPTGKNWADFPTLGLNNDRLTIGANMFVLGPSNVPAQLAPSGTPNLVTIPLASLLAGNVNNLERFSIDTFAPQPVVDLDNLKPPGPSSRFITQPVLGQLAQGFFTTRHDLLGIAGMPSLLFPIKPDNSTPTLPYPNAPQMGSNALIDTGDTRFSANVVLQNGTIWAVRTDGVNQCTGNLVCRSGIEWFKIDQNTNTILQSGLISRAFGSSAFFFYYPSIAVSKDGFAVISFSGSRPTQDVGAFAAVGKTVNGVTTFDPVRSLGGGFAPYERTSGDTRVRWGDYSATVLDPDAAHHFWSFQEFALAQDQWATRITDIFVKSVVLAPKNTIVAQEVLNGSGQAANGFQMFTQGPFAAVNVRGVTKPGETGPGGLTGATFTVENFGPPLAAGGKLLVALAGAGPNVHIDAQASQFSLNGRFLPGSVRSIGAPPALSFDPRSGEAFADFFNPEDFTLHLSEVELFLDNDITHLTLADFMRPTGPLVDGIPTAFDLFPGQIFRLSFGLISPSPETYLLALADIAAPHNLDTVFRVAAAGTFSVPDPPSVLLLGMGLAACMGLARRRSPR